MASINLLRASDGTGPAALMTIQQVRAPLSTTIEVDTIVGVPSTFMATMGTPDASTGIITDDTAVDFRGHIDGSNLEIDAIEPGFTDIGSQVGDVVVLKPTTSWSNEVVDILGVSHNDDGTIKETAVYSAIEEKGVLGNIHYYMANDTWTKPDNLKFVIVEVQGAGGGGGGSSNTSDSNGRGGGGGGFGRKKILAGDLAATETVTVGAAGSAGSNTGSGGDGGDSSFGSHVTGKGGSGGASGSSSGNGGSGGSVTGADFSVPGQRGAAGGLVNSIWAMYYRPGFGGSSYLGTGANNNSTGGANRGGDPGNGYGAGGSGGSNNGNPAGGGAGAPGIVIVYEYF